MLEAPFYDKIEKQKLRAVTSLPLSHPASRGRTPFLMQLPSWHPSHCNGHTALWAISKPANLGSGVYSFKIISKCIMWLLGNKECWNQRAGRKTVTTKYIITKWSLLSLFYWWEVIPISVVINREKAVVMFLMSVFLSLKCSIISDVYQFVIIEVLLNFVNVLCVLMLYNQNNSKFSLGIVCKPSIPIIWEAETGEMEATLVPIASWKPPRSK